MKRTLAVLAVLVAPAAADTKQVEWSDSPAWSESSKDTRILLLWDVGEVRKSKDPNALPLRPVDVVLQLGDVTRRIKVPAEYGGLSPYNQVICKTSAYPLGGNEVAKLTFYEGGAGGYAVERPADDVLEIYHWAQTDGACQNAKGEMVACPRSHDLVAKLHIPKGVVVGGGAIFTTDGGKQSKLACE